MPREPFYWRGRPASTLTRDDLIEVILDMAHRERETAARRAHELRVLGA